jgi:hypothetical protein
VIRRLPSLLLFATVAAMSASMCAGWLEADPCLADEAFAAQSCAHPLPQAAR